MHTKTAYYMHVKTTYYRPMHAKTADCMHAKTVYYMHSNKLRIIGTPNSIFAHQYHEFSILFTILFLNSQQAELTPCVKRLHHRFAMLSPPTFNSGLLLLRLLCVGHSAISRKQLLLIYCVFWEKGQNIA